MPLEISLIRAEDRLDLSVRGRLDLSLSGEIARLIGDLPSDLRTCIIDLTEVDRVFDSGLALLWMLGERLHGQGILVVALSDHLPLIQRLPFVMRHAYVVVPQDTASEARDRLTPRHRHYAPQARAADPEPSIQRRLDGPGGAWLPRGGCGARLTPEAGQAPFPAARLEDPPGSEVAVV